MALISQTVAVEVSEWQRATMLVVGLALSVSWIWAAVTAWPQGTTILITSRRRVEA